MHFARTSTTLAKAFVLAPLLAVSLSSVAACEGCHATSGGTPPVTPESSSPTLRLYVMSDLAGALEPCGCVKDQLGGLDHFAAWATAERAKAKTSVLVAAGPTFFLDPLVKDDHKAQDLEKARTLATSLKGLGLVAFAPGKNDWAGGAPFLSELAEASGASILFGNDTTPDAPPGWRKPLVKDFQGVKVGFLGVSLPDRAEGGAPSGVTTSAPVDAVKAELADAKQQGAVITVLLAAVGRGEAKRIADVVPDLTAIVVGSPGGSGDANSETPPPERIGNVLIAETGNHLTTVGVLDLYVREGSYVFADGSGLAQASRRSDLSRRIDELRGRIAQWESANALVDGGAHVAQADIDARKADLAKLEAERLALDTAPAPAKGSFFRYTQKEIRDDLGKDTQVTAALAAYYKKVNDANKIAFQSRVPRPAKPNEASFIGVEECTTCHDDAREVWDKTAHAHAYASLSKQSKEFNLDCVSCHVTGYDLPGGSTVTHVDKLENVGCEVCHGPGSLHAKSPKKTPMPVAKPQPDTCLACHHPPHVHEFDAKAKMADILGPGHGK